MNGLSPEALETSRPLAKNRTALSTYPQNFTSNLAVILSKNLSQWRLKHQFPDKKKSVIYNHNLNALIKAPVGVVTAFPNDPNPLFSSRCNSQESIASSCNTSLCSETKLKSYLYYRNCISHNTDRSRELHFQSPYPNDEVLWET